MSDHTIINLCRWTTMMYPYRMVGNPDISDADYPEPSHTSAHRFIPQAVGWAALINSLFHIFQSKKCTRLKVTDMRLSSSIEVPSACLTHRFVWILTIMSGLWSEQRPFVVPSLRGKPAVLRTLWRWVRVMSSLQRRSSFSKIIPFFQIPWHITKSASHQPPKKGRES